MNVGFQVPSVAAPQGSKRHFGNGMMVESSKKVKPYRELVGYVALRAMNCGKAEIVRDGPVSVSLVFAFPRLKKHLRRTNGKTKDGAPLFVSTQPDIDKLTRSTLDGMTGIVFKNDGQVSQLTARKIYTDGPGYVSVIVSSIDHDSEVRK